MMKAYMLKFAEIQDISAWMALVDIVKDNFPGLDSHDEINQYQLTLRKNIKRKTAICVKLSEKVVGLLLFSLKSNCLSCMAVHPDHRQSGIATEMIEKTIELFPRDMDISVTTFRENDPLGTAPRALYKKFGFIEGDLIEEFNYPHQKFILHRS